MIQFMTIVSRRSIASHVSFMELAKMAVEWNRDPYKPDESAGDYKL